MKVRIFGILTDVLKCSEMEMHVVSDTDTFKKVLYEKYPVLKDHTFQITLNSEKVTKNILLNENDEIALLPPFAGG